MDFSDFGLPSTYGESLYGLIRILDMMVAACWRAGAEIAMIEIADGLLQRETQMLLESEDLRRRVRGVVVAGACSTSLLFATQYLAQLGHELLGGLRSHYEFTTLCPGSYLIEAPSSWLHLEGVLAVWLKSS